MNPSLWFGDACGSLCRVASVEPGCLAARGGPAALLEPTGVEGLWALGLLFKILHYMLESNDCFL